LGHPEALDRIRRKLKSSGGEDAKAAVAIIFNEEFLVGRGFTPTGI